MSPHPRHVQRSRRLTGAALEAACKACNEADLPGRLTKKRRTAILRRGEFNRRIVRTIVVKNDEGLPTGVEHSLHATKGWRSRWVGA